MEEVLSNAVYHKSYELGSPIEVQVWPDKIEVLSFPGPVPPIDARILHSQQRIVARDYRNRRIGDFLKELDLTEGRGTGFPTIYRAMKNNGSPKPIFDTDEQSTHFLVTLLVHPSITGNQEGNQVSVTQKVLNINNLGGFLSWIDQVSDQVSDQVKLFVTKFVGNLAETLLLKLQRQDLSKKELLNSIGLSNHTKNKVQEVLSLFKSGGTTALKDKFKGIEDFKLISFLIVR